MDRDLQVNHPGGFDKAFTEAAEKGVKDYMLSKTNVTSVWTTTFRGVVTISPSDILSKQGGEQNRYKPSKGCNERQVR